MLTILVTILQQSNNKKAWGKLVTKPF